MSCNCYQSIWKPSEAAELSNQNPINLISSSVVGLLMEATLLIGNEIQISFILETIKNNKISFKYLGLRRR